MEPTVDWTKVTETGENSLLALAAIFFMAKAIYELTKGRSGGASLSDALATLTAAITALTGAVAKIRDDIDEQGKAISRVEQRAETIERIAGSTKDDTSYIKARVNGGGAR